MSFLLWIFARITYRQKQILFNGCMIILERGEFVFGRKKCSEETGISEQTLRTFLKNLTNIQWLEKVTSKSTSKYTVYKVLLEHFGEIPNHQNHQLSTSRQPSTNHNQEKEGNIKESLLGLDRDGLFPVHLDRRAAQLFRKLPFHEQEGVISLFEERNSQKPIQHPSSWFMKCIKEEWHHRYTSFPTGESGKNVEVNRLIAQEAAGELGHHSDIICYVGRDFLEIRKLGQVSGQIFYHESRNIFRAQLKFVLDKFKFAI